jgi:DNA (cytosine-5)-methyltransferase 1
MSAYYNENDPFAAQWLKELIRAGLVAPGEVDERSIVDVRPDDLWGFVQCHFFAGIGGWSYALRLAGWPDDRPVWTGSCPCQPFSQAGKRKGFADDRHLWPVWFGLIRDCRPGIIFGEQVASAAEWLGLVRSDLGSVDYVVGARPFEAASAGADHLRNRFWVVAYDHRAQGRRVQRSGAGAGAACERPSDQFVGPGDHLVLVDVESDGRSEGRPEYEVRRGWDAPARASRVDGDVAGPASAKREYERPVADGMPGGHSNGRGEIDVAHHHLRPQGRRLSAEGAAERPARPDGVADTDQPCGRLRDEQPAGELAQQQQDTRARDGGEFEWVLGADGKARRVKPGIRLLVDGFPNRVGILRGFGNAIDPRPAKEFISAFMECQP